MGSSQTTDAQLHDTYIQTSRQFAQDSRGEEAAKELFLRHHGYVYPAVLALRSGRSRYFLSWLHYLECVADDVLPYAFAVSIRKFDTTKGTAFATWWVHVSVLQFENELRKRQRVPDEYRLDDPANAVEILDPRASNHFQQSVILCQVESILVRMTPDHRDIFELVLHPEEGVPPLTLSDYARLRGLSKDQAKYRKKRARSEFLALWDDPSSAAS